MDSTPQKTPLRLLLYSHDSQGLGHVRRNLALAHQLARLLPDLIGRPVAGLLVSGLSQASSFPLPKGFDWVFIPSVHKAPEGYASRFLGTSTQHLVALRSQLLQACLLGFSPDLVLIDRHIFGVMRELQKPLEELRRQRPGVRLVLGLREVLDEPQVAHAEWYKHGDPADLARLLDALWIYGDQRVHDPLASGEIPAVLADRAAFTGYLAEGREATEPARLAQNFSTPFILSTAGGGQDGFALLEAAVQVAPPAGYEHLVVAGPQLPEQSLRALEELKAPGVRLFASLPGLAGLIGRASALISMAGYNTSNELLATDTPALLVPREQPRAEQLIRARALAKLGLVDLCRQQDVSPQYLTSWLDSALGRSVDRSGLERQGLTVAAHLAADLLSSTPSLASTQEASWNV